MILDPISVIIGLICPKKRLIFYSVDFFYIDRLLQDFLIQIYGLSIAILSPILIIVRSAALF